MPEACLACELQGELGIDQGRDEINSVAPFACATLGCSPALRLAECSAGQSAPSKDADSGLLRPRGRRAAPHPSAAPARTGRPRDPRRTHSKAPPSKAADAPAGHPSPHRPALAPPPGHPEVGTLHRIGRPPVSTGDAASSSDSPREPAWGYKRIQGELPGLRLAHPHAAPPGLKGLKIPPAPKRPTDTTWRDVPAHPGIDDARHRLLPRRLRNYPPAPVLLLRDRDRFPPCAHPRRDHESGRPWTTPADPEPPDGSRRWRAADFRLLVRDRAGQFTESFDEVLASACIEAVKIPPRSPRANSYAERFVLTARHRISPTGVLIFGQRHLRTVLAEYETHYNARRPHRSRQLHPPRPDYPVADPSQERIKRRPVLGGLVNEYERAA